MEDIRHGRARPRGLLTTADTDLDGVRIAVVHDYLTQRGGAERVVLALLAALPTATLHTSLYERSATYPEFQAHRISTMPINRVRFLRRHHRVAFPVLAPSFGSYSVDADVVLCSSSGWAHGVRTTGRKVVYCHTPARWLYQARRYAGREGAASVVKLASATALGLPLRRWDRRAASTAHRYLANSRAVQSRIRDLYGIEAELVPPPVTIDVDGAQEPVEGIEPGFLLCVSRLLPYKNVDTVLEAMRSMSGERLVVVGTGPERARLAGSAPANAALIGAATDAQMRWLYQHCRAVVAASHEDFGLVPLEAAAFGKPSAALRWGGFLDTIVDGETGTFFNQARPALIASAVSRLDMTVDAAVLKAHAAGYRLEKFACRVRRIVADVHHSPG